MKKLLLWVLFLTAFSFGILGSEAYSQATETGKPVMQCEKNFDVMDTNHDGMVSITEFLAFDHKGRNAGGNLEEVFKTRDTNNDGMLTKEEFCSGKGPGK